MSKNIHILFFLPEYYENPIGGYKVVFEYANRLVKDGYRVSIVYPSFLFFRKSSLKRKLKMLFFYFYHLVIKRKGVTGWFALDGRIENKYVFSLQEKFIPKADYYFATANETAFHLDRFKGIQPDRKFYLIQALEDWQWGKEKAIETWKYNLRKVVISPWLLSLVNEIGEKAVLIENGVDREGLFNYVEAKDKDPNLVVMLYHKQKLKGSEDGLKALLKARECNPNLRAIFFGCPRKPSGLPSWITYYRTPSESLLNKLYNEAAIYLGPSHSEGFGLTVGEAMTCGCAVVCTDAGGYLTMANQGETALVVKVGDTDAMADAILALMDDASLRCSLVSNAQVSIRRFTWDNAYTSFKALLDQTE